MLGASEDASRREIERLYKRQAHKRHPDRGGAEEDMKALNEAYRVLHNEVSRREYDSSRRQSVGRSVPVTVASPTREVGVHGQALSALLCMILGLMLLLMVRFNGLWFLWPLSILAVGVIGFGVLMAHSAMSNALKLSGEKHPVRKFRPALEIVFWLAVLGGAFALYVILTAI